MNENRQPKGTPNGGQFAPTSTPESGVVLIDDDHDRWEKVEGCPTCSSPDPRTPYHFASERCLSGKHIHCSCGTCY